VGRAACRYEWHNDFSRYFLERYCNHELLSTDLNLHIFKRTWANPAAPDFAFNQLHHQRAVFDAVDLRDVGMIQAASTLASRSSQISLSPGRLGCILRPMSFRPVRKIAGIGNVFLGTELVDIAEYDLEIYEENPEDHEHHGANWTPNAKKIEGTVVGELPIRKDLRLLTEEGYSVNFYLRDSFGSVVVLNPMLDSSGKPVR
jgi:hypothetical protein